jgi:hypothetical protein
MRFFIALAFLLVSVSAMAEPVEWPVGEGGNGHFYEKFDGPEILAMTWREAEQFAESLEHNGLHGHLATMISQAEYGFVSQVNNDSSIGYLVHVGAWDNEGEDPEYEGDLGWRWITGETFDPNIIPNQLGELRNSHGAVLGFWCGPSAHTWYCDWWRGDPDTPMNQGCIIVEYDNFPVIDPLPEVQVAREARSWGALKGLYR